MDFIGTYLRMPRYLLVIVDYTTRYPEAILLPSLTSTRVTQALMHFFPHVGLPKALLTDWGSPFMSTLMERVCQMLGIKQLFEAIQHPQTDRLTERINQTIKGMLANTI